MKYLITILTFGVLLYSCDASKSSMQGDKDTNVASDTVRIANDSLEYEILIIEPGFNSFLISQPPKGYYSLTFLENRNRIFVTEYNLRVSNALQYGPSLYPQRINYEFNVDYGMEVNYKLYNYFLYFQQKYNQRFPGSRN
ncbi:DUF6146 family protein [Patiriisocius hiemis]|uniref:DUF6146 family protein n=1 Tax=Patiriisocius hiemis TaxID=3075604 RepID=A0ABU2Y9Q2_9FLAO|nr:DUF6146 family protein [Constantimarinum sp. W242]MDT0554913.1 DUF6146 family protein [Constantimarinum sp. W242]